MLTGPNYNAIGGVCDRARCFVIASGGVGNADHVRRLRALGEQHENLTGIIVGKALYDGRVSLADLEA
jgi:phosphoribosylformimino-5-aminoimidazole carboxamide ribotide isomerase